MTVPHFTTSTATAAALNVLVDTVNSLYALLVDRVGVRLRRVANQAVTQSLTTNITWDTEDEDTDGFITVPSTTITIPTGMGGIYALTVHLAGNVDTSARFLIIVVVTSALTGYPSAFRAPPGNGTEDLITAGFPSLALTAGDTVQVQTFHNSVAAVNMTGWMSFYRVSV